MENKKQGEKVEEKINVEKEKQVEEKMKTVQEKTNAEPGEEGRGDKQLTKEITKDKKKQAVKKEKAIIDVRNLGISTKHSMAICDFIRRKNPEQAIKELEQVVKLKRAIPMKGEIPHRKGMMSGRYPINASKVFIKLIKQLIGNASVNGIGEPYISLAKANKASRPHRRGGSMRFKRTNILLEAREKVEKTVNAKEKRNVEQGKKSKKDMKLGNNENKKQLEQNLRRKEDNQLINKNKEENK